MVGAAVGYKVGEFDGCSVGNVVGSAVGLCTVKTAPPITLMTPEQA